MEAGEHGGVGIHVPSPAEVEQRPDQDPVTTRHQLIAGRGVPVLVQTVLTVTHILAQVR